VSPGALPSPAHIVHVHVCFTTALTAPELAADEALLGPDELERARRFAFERDRRDFVCAHALLRRALSICAGGVAPEAWRYEREEGGKPTIAAPAAYRRIGFNLAHTHGCVVCAIAHDAVGVDVEPTARAAASIDLVPRVLAPLEIGELNRLPEAERPLRFIELWTLKEAYLKAVGSGLVTPLQAFAFGFDGPSSLRFWSDSGDLDWRFALIAADRYRVAVAARTAAPVIAMHTDERLRGRSGLLVPLRRSPDVAWSDLATSGSDLES
jgi:4'-phosphopantetheinyl transferase